MPRAAGADVPTICQHDRLSNSGACRMCLVRSRRGAPVAACVTRLPTACSIVTDDPVVENARRFVLEMTAHRHLGTAVEHDPSRRSTRCCGATR
jgi:NADH dehydrogenase/NADH:ubiquinone oxidoreductase subunit G